MSELPNPDAPQPPRCTEPGCIRPAWQGSPTGRCWWCEAAYQERNPWEKNRLDLQAHSAPLLSPMTGETEP